MSHIAVLATAISPLHADLIIVRLKRAGVPVCSISAMYAHTCGPTSALTWLSGPARFPLLLEKRAFVSGPLRADLSDAGNDGDSLTERLIALGLPPDHCTTLLVHRSLAHTASSCACRLPMTSAWNRSLTHTGPRMRRASSLRKSDSGMRRRPRSQPWERWLEAHRFGLGIALFQARSNAIASPGVSANNWGVARF